MTLNKKIAAAIAAGTILAATLLPGAAFASNDNTCTISNSGAYSWNKCKIKIVTITTTTKTNVADVGNLVSVGALTGGNSSDHNTGGSNTVTTGGVSISISISNVLNTNQ